MRALVNIGTTVRGQIVLMFLLAAFQCRSTGIVRAETPGEHASIAAFSDESFITTALTLVDLIATYSPQQARRQFQRAREMLVEPARSQFEQTMLGTELRAITETKRTQRFAVHRESVQIERFPSDRDGGVVVVKIPGTRSKLIGAKALPDVEMLFYVKIGVSTESTGSDPKIVVRDVKLRRATETITTKLDSGNVGGGGK